MQALATFNFRRNAAIPIPVRTVHIKFVKEQHAKDDV